MQASLFVQVRKGNNAHAVAQRNDVTVASFHGSRQIIRMISESSARSSVISPLWT